MNRQRPDNDEIAQILEDVAQLLQLKGDNPFRVRAYRRAARRARHFREPLADLYDRRGTDGLQYIDGIGEKLSRSIVEIIETGKLQMLTRLEAEISPVDVFSRLPGLGPKLAERIVDHLEIESLEELERAVHDGRLEDQVPGIGSSRARGIGQVLAGMLNRGARRRAQSRLAEQTDADQTDDEQPEGHEGPPPVELLLALDAEYRRKARQGKLRTIAPRRFNPDNERWLPVMNTRRAGWNFTVLYSNTRRAHELDRTHDWVVIYVENDRDRQYTVVTATSGPMADKRVVRGREAECRRIYERRHQAHWSR